MSQFESCMFRFSFLNLPNVPWLERGTSYFWLGQLTQCWGYWTKLSKMKWKWVTWRHDTIALSEDYLNVSWSISVLVWVGSVIEIRELWYWCRPLLFQGSLNMIARIGHVKKEGMGGFLLKKQLREEMEMRFNLLAQPTTSFPFPHLPREARGHNWEKWLIWLEDFIEGVHISTQSISFERERAEIVKCFPRKGPLHGSKWLKRRTH